ncbi:hypothetical protein [Iningainema tapete]|uniref:hypothetical protein n=1 Tax=Iningainema tapete TaxID=2806730 RepID=UPI001EE344E5|nr:hypothetical protein [Iningainema tapete]
MMKFCKPFGDLELEDIQQALRFAAAAVKERELKTLTESLQPETPTEAPEYPLTKFYGCIQDETFFRHPQGQQQEREAIL